MRGFQKIRIKYPLGGTLGECLRNPFGDNISDKTFPQSWYGCSVTLVGYVANNVEIAPDKNLR